MSYVPPFLPTVPSPCCDIRLKGEERRADKIHSLTVFESEAINMPSRSVTICRLQTFGLNPLRQFPKVLLLQ